MIQYPVNRNMFLTLEQFLSFFPPIQITREQFVHQFVVTYTGNPTLHDLFTFKSVIKSEDDPRYQQREEIIDYFYDIIIVNRHRYLTEFYKSYFDLPNFYGLKWDGINIHHPESRDFNNPVWIDTWKQYLENPNETEIISKQFEQLLEQPLSSLSLQKNDQSRRIIRNLNYFEILHRTSVTNTCKSKTSFWQTFLNVYNHLRLEDRFFAPSSIGLFLRKKETKTIKLMSLDKSPGPIGLIGPIETINYNNFYYLFQQYQPKASILNPYTINWILKNVMTGTRLFTPVLSWASYLCAFMHSDWEHYVGVDVMPGVCERCHFLFDYYQRELSCHVSEGERKRLQTKHLDLYCRPSESLLYDPPFLNRFHGYFDSILICPPYYNMEIYPDGQQSIISYPNYEEWLEGYWNDTVALCQIVLRRSGRFGMIVNDYVSLKKESYPLIKDLNLIVLKYFKLVNVFKLLNRTSPLRVNHKTRTEMLFIYEKL